MELPTPEIHRTASVTRYHWDSPNKIAGNAEYERAYDGPLSLVPGGHPTGADQRPDKAADALGGKHHPQRLGAHSQYIFRHHREQHLHGEPEQHVDVHDADEGSVDAVGPNEAHPFHRVGQHASTAHSCNGRHLQEEQHKDIDGQARRRDGKDRPRRQHGGLGFSHDAGQDETRDHR